MLSLLETEDFQAAKDALERAKQATEQARQDRLSFLGDALIRAEACLARVKQQALELPALIARYRAEIAKLEATTGADILREAMDALKAECWGPPGEVVEVQSPKPQPEAQSAASAEKLFMPGLPPEALRKVWPEWQDEAGDVVTFKDEQYRWAHWHSSTPSKRVHDVPWNHLKLRPHGATQAHVEALAQQAQTPKPHACPRCDEGMQALERTALATGLEGAIPPPSKWCDGSRKG